MRAKKFDTNLRFGRLGQHVRVHCIVTDGGLSPDRERWLAPRHKGFLFPVRALSKVFRGKYLDLLSAARDRGELRPLRDADEFGRLKDALKGKDWSSTPRLHFPAPTRC